MTARSVWCLAGAVRPASGAGGTDRPAARRGHRGRARAPRSPPARSPAGCRRADGRSAPMRDGSTLIEGEVGREPARPLHEQLAGLRARDVLGGRALCREAEARDPMDCLTRDVEPLAACGEHAQARAGSQQPLDQTAHASTRCSQLSSTSSASRPRSDSARTSACERSTLGIWSAVLISCGTSAPSTRDASSTIHTPSVKRSTCSRATRALDVFYPHPPAPMIVTNRLPIRSCSRRMSSAALPTKLLIGIGKLFMAREMSATRCTGSSSFRPRPARRPGWRGTATARSRRYRLVPGRAPKVVRCSFVGLLKPRSRSLTARTLRSLRVASSSWVNARARRCSRRSCAKRGVHHGCLSASYEAEH